jgi:hypothetical protein
MNAKGVIIAAVFVTFVVIGLLLMPSSASASTLGDTGDFSQQIIAFAQAIAVAEGYQDQNGNLLTGNVPAKANNPGDLVLSSGLSSLLTSGWTGQTLGEGIAVYNSTGAGWNALYNQLQFIVNGQSGLADYDTDTISDLAYNWTTTNQDAWAETVAGQLGVTPDTPLNQVLS